MVPESGSSNPAMILKMVVLPQPLGPMMLTKSRSLMQNERSSSTAISPALPEKDFRTLRTLNWTGAACMAGNTQLVCHAAVFKNLFSIKVLRPWWRANWSVCCLFRQSALSQLAAKVGLANAWVLRKGFRASRQRDRAGFQHEGTVGDFERHRRVLLDQENT